MTDDSESLPHATSEDPVPVPGPTAGGASHPVAMLVTDLDGTLLDPARRVGVRDQRTLRSLAERGVLRVVATGRSPHSFAKVTIPDGLLDFVVLSSGAAVLDCRSGSFIRTVRFEQEQAREIMELLVQLDVDFTVHDQAPHNHRFRYHASSTPCSDFQPRLEYEPELASPLEPLSRRGRHHGAERHCHQPVSQFIVYVEHERVPGLLPMLRERLHPLTVVRTTSPLTGKTTWIEIFPEGVSKSHAARRIARSFGITPERVLAVGNDYNDLDLLEWSGASFVVANAPRELQKRFPAVASNEHGGVSQAVERWLAVSNMIR